MIPETVSSRRRLVLFDFDGTLVDSFLAALAAGNRLACRFGYESITEEEARKLREKGVRQILSDAKIPLRKLPIWLAEMKREMRHDFPSLQPYVGIQQALEELHSRGITLGIITSNSAENLEAFLNRHDWTRFFSHLESGSTLFGKRRLIRHALTHIGIPASQSAYVGDEVRDMEAAHKAGVQAVAVTWGFNARSALAATDPDQILESPSDLAGFFPEALRSIADADLDA